MKTEQPILITSVEAQSDLSKHYCIKPDGSLASSEGDSFLGVCNADTLQGEQMPVMVKGIALVYSADAIIQGKMVITSDDGLVSQLEPATTIENYIVGIALDSASGANELIRVLLR